MSDDETLRDPRRGQSVRALRVTVVAGPDAGASVTNDDCVTIGTAKANDLVLSDETISRHHLELSRAQDEIAVEDLASTNGTYLYGARLARGWIKPGTVLRIGRSQISIEDGALVQPEIHPEARLGGMIGAGEPMKALMARIERAAALDTSVLVLGETGTGKEVVARTIHELSPRKTMPFEVLDCGAVLSTLLASELFGHEKGAFTGADRRHAGALERAEGGTLLLDEIGELPLALQTALLGVLERKTFRRLGGEETLSLGARVISATHRDLRAGVNQGTFRADLYYRIAVVLLKVPPLRERKSEIPLLVEHFAKAVGLSDCLEATFPPAVLRDLESHDWPGNVRELRNTVEAALAMGERPALEGREAAPPTEGQGASIALDRFLPLPYPEAKDQVLEAFDAQYLRALLERSHGNVSKAATLANVHRSYLTRLLRRAGIRMRRSED